MPAIYSRSLVFVTLATNDPEMTRCGPVVQISATSCAGFWYDARPWRHGAARFSPK